MLLFAFGLDPDPILESCDDSKEAMFVEFVLAPPVRPEWGFASLKLNARGQAVSAQPQAAQYGVLGLGGQQGFLQLQLSL